jgi:hypothetical protein
VKDAAWIPPCLAGRQGNQTLTAEVRDIDRVTLHSALKKHGWKREAASVLEKNSGQAFGSVPLSRLEELSRGLMGEFRVPRGVLSPLPEPSLAFNVARRQYLSTEILATMTPQATPGAWRVFAEPPRNVHCDPHLRFDEA